MQDVRKLGLLLRQVKIRLFIRCSLLSNAFVIILDLGLPARNSQTSKVSSSILANRSSNAPMRTHNAPPPWVNTLRWGAAPCPRHRTRKLVNSLRYRKCPPPFRRRWRRPSTPLTSGRCSAAPGRRASAALSIPARSSEACSGAP